MAHAGIAAAVTAFQQGELTRARQLGQELLARREPSPLLFHLLGLIECRLGQFEAGTEYLRSAVEADAENLSYRIAYCRALIDSGRAVDALLVATPPGGTGAVELEMWKVRAEAAFYAGDRAAEADCWAVVADARPEDAMAWTNLGRSLLSQLRFAEAETAYRRALAITPALMIRHELGLALERSNRLEALGDLLDQALVDGVAKDQLADLWALRAYRSGDLTTAAELADRIDIRSDPFRLNAMKAKIADAAGRPSEAFAAALAMNWSVGNPAEWRSRARAYREGIRQRTANLEAIASTKVRLQQPEGRKLAFLIGFPRSGTTLTDIFLKGHPGVHVLEEVPLLEDAAQRLGGIARLNCVGPEALSAARDQYLADLDRLLPGSSGGLVIDKMPLNLLNLPLIAVLFPESPIILARRHPCDCVLSAFMQAFVPSTAMASFLDIEDAADFYDAAMSFFFAAREKLDVRIHDLVYEELVADPERVLRSIVAALDLDWRNEVLDHRSTAARQAVIKTPSYDSVGNPLSRRAIGRWHNYEDHLRPVLPVLLRWATQLGYGDR